MTLLDLFDASVAERPDALAVNDVSYAELAAGTLRVARALGELGLGSGDRIALFCENRLAFAYVYLAALRLGAIAVPANVLYRASDLAQVLTDAVYNTDAAATTGSVSYTAPTLTWTGTLAIGAVATVTGRHHSSPSLSPRPSGWPCGRCRRPAR